MKGLIVIKAPGLAIQVCTCLPASEVEAAANIEHPAGTENGWSFSDAVEQGVTCAEYPDRKHYVLDC